MTRDLLAPSDVYLGDGLYASFDGWQFKLYAHNGVNLTNEVYLDPEVLQAFIRYAKSAGVKL